MPERDVEYLLSGYATNTLTQEERKTLFDAALGDQTLFDALAKEQALKDLLDDPQSRRRLIDALTKADPGTAPSWSARVLAWVREPASWALTGSLASASVAVYTLGYLLVQTSPLPQEALLTADSRQFTELQMEQAGELSDEQGIAVDDLEMMESPKKRSAPLSPSERFNLAASATKAPAPTVEGEAAPARKVGEPEATSEVSSLEAKQDIAESEADVVSELVEPPVEPPKVQAYVSLAYRSGKARDLYSGGEQRAQADVRGYTGKAAAGALRAEEGSVADAPQEATTPSAQIGRLSKTEASTGPAAGPLGLRYAILKRAKDGSYGEASPDEVFDVGASLRLAVEVNRSGFLYVLHRMPAPGWKVLYPISETGSAMDARVTAETRYVVPLGIVRAIKNRAVRTRTIIVYSRKLLPDFGSIAATIRRNEKRGGTRAAPIDAFINRTRSKAAGQELVLEKVRPTRKSPQRERAVYVVNANKNPEAYIFLELVMSQR